MKHNPSLDQITEAYLTGVVKLPDNTTDTEHHCPHAAQGCTCGGCPECQAVETGHDQEHDPSEIKMALAELRKAKEYAGKLEEMLQSAHGLEGWTAAKITKASDYLSSVYHWLDYESGDSGCEDKSKYVMGYEDGE